MNFFLLSFEPELGSSFQADFFLGGGIVFPDTQLNIPELALLFLRH